MSGVFYIGGYWKNDSICLHCCEITGSAIHVSESYELQDASYVCLSPDKKNLYAVIETQTFDGCKGGGVAAFAVENGGKLRFINNAPTEGEHPCHLTVSGDGRRLYVANYTGGSSIIYELTAAGGIGSKVKLIDHNCFGTPSKIFESRQGHPHSHFIGPVSISSKEALWVCDLGLDKLLILDETGNELTHLAMPGGFGPRHVAFHPSLPVAYVVGELGQGVVAVGYSADATGQIMLKADAPVLVSPGAAVSCAAIKVSPCSGYVLVSNRGSRGDGADSLSVLKLADDGSISELLDVYKTRGRCPRDFAFTPGGDGVMVAYQDSDFIELLGWAGDGKLAPAQMELSLPKPTCVLFY